MTISLSSGLRSNLLTLQQTDKLLTRTQERLASGKKVNSALDGAQAFFAAQANNGRADDLISRKDGIGQSIQVVQAANNGITAISNLLDQARGLIATAQASVDDTSDDTSLQSQYAEILTQLDTIVGDSGYQGTNLLTSAAQLVTTFDPAGTDTLTISGFDASSTGLTVQATIDPTAATNLSAADASITAAKATLRAEATTLSSSVSILNARDEFTNDLINTLRVGADKLTLADTNEEGANMLALQTRQQLGTISLSLASQASQAVLQLF